MIDTQVTSISARYAVYRPIQHGTIVKSHARGIDTMYTVHVCMSSYPLQFQCKQDLFSREPINSSQVAV